MDWSPDSWRRFEARQQPAWPDPAALRVVEDALRERPPLVTHAEVAELKRGIAGAQAGRALMLQGGDCAETFAPSAPGAAAADLALLDEAARRIEASGLPALRVARMAGQFAKPRSAPEERRGPLALPAWQGDIVNARAFDPAARRPEPRRMLTAWDKAAALLGLLRARGVAASHEALLLPFEQALVRRDGTSGRSYAGSAHFLWIGYRTLFEGSAHVELLRGLANPIGLKIGPGLTPAALLRLLDRLDPDGEPGRITLIARLGAGAAPTRLPPLMAAVRDRGGPVLWLCDPMHGNTARGADGAKRRSPAAMRAELDAFFAAARDAGVGAGGLHLEMTAASVEECSDEAPAAPAATPCDPRLNAGQALELAARAAALLRQHRQQPLPYGEMVD